MTQLHERNEVTSQRAAVQPSADAAAKVVFLRPSPEASIYNFPILHDAGNVVALLAPESQTMIVVAPGERRFEVRAMGTTDVVHATLASAKTYYVLCRAVRTTASRAGASPPSAAIATGSTR
jgi:hypothetical protein